MKKASTSHLFAVSILFFCMLVFPKFVNGQEGKGYKVWVKTSPCSGRHDWISVAKDNPSGGGNFFYPANQIFPGTVCTTDGCTFKEAMAVAATLRPSPEFFKYCCRDYSVWQNSQTKKMTVVLGKMGTAGPGWDLVKGDLCCEEAEAMAGIPGACSGSDKTNPQTQVANTKCYPGSYAAWNKKLKRVECYCKKGLVWNSTRTACVDPQELVKSTDCSGLPGSYAAWNAQAQRVECFCPDGKTWNAAKTACVDKVAKVECYPGSTAAWNAQTQRTECFCNKGLVWNAAKTACVDPQELVKSTDCSGLPGSYAAWNAQAQRVECFCPDGKIWNAAKTACVDKVAQVTCYPGSSPAWNAQTQRTECFCNQGLVWNSTKTACVQPSGTTTDGTTTGGTTGANANYTWTLVSASVNPPNAKANWPNGEWSYDAQSTAATMSLYNGSVVVNFGWTVPQTFTTAGSSDIAIGVKAQAPAGQNIAALIGVSGEGVVTEPADAESSAYAKGIGSAGANKSVKFKPTPSASEIKVNVSLNWSTVVYTYTYRRTQ